VILEGIYKGDFWGICYEEKIIGNVLRRIYMGNLCGVPFEMKIFSGFMSRCTMKLLCMYFIPSNKVEISYATFSSYCFPVSKK
jgi:hypothetical protein